MFKNFADWLTDLLYKPGKKRWFIVLTIFLTFLSPLLLLASFSYITTYQDLTNFTLSRRQAIAYLAATTLKKDLDRLIDIGISLATRVRFRQLVGQGKWIEAIEILRTVPKDFSFIDRIFLTDPTGTLIADTPELPGVRGRNFAFRDWYQGVSNKWEPYVSEVYKRAAEPRLNVIAIAAPIKGENQKVIGILVLQVRLDTLFEWTKNVEVGPSGFVYFVDRRGHVAAHPGVPSQSEIVDYSSAPAVQKVLRGEKGVEIAFNPIENEERVAAYHPISGYGWGVIVQQPVSSAFVQRNDSLRRLLFVHGLIFLLASSLAYITLRTIAERKRAEDEIRKLNDELKLRAEQLEATNKELEAFTYSVSHDLRAPLRHVDGFSKILAGEFGPKLDSTAQRYLQYIQEGTKNMGQLIDDLLNLARVGRKELSLQVTGLNSLIDEVLADLKLETEGREFDWQIGKLPFVECDPALIKQVLANLLSNAVKFTRPRERAVIEVGQMALDGQTAVFVHDNGVGFSMKYADKLFGVFQRLHRQEDFEGTGVGLATVQRIIHKHGGRVWAEAELDKGATFYFTLGTQQKYQSEKENTLAEGGKL